MLLSVVIPCYNEALNISILLKKLEVLNSPNIEVIIVNNGSTDETQEILNRLMPQYPNYKLVKVEINNGYGFGILAGLNSAKGEYIGWTHADLQTDPADVLTALNLLLSDKTISYAKGNRVGRRVNDSLFTFGMSLFETLLLRNLLWDINAQPNIFTRSFFNTWFNPPFDFSLDLYALYKAKLSNNKVIRFPVFFSKRINGVSHWNFSLLSKMLFVKRTILYSLNLRKLVKNEINCSQKKHD